MHERTFQGFLVMMVLTRGVLWRPSGSSDPSDVVFEATGCLAPDLLVEFATRARPPRVCIQLAIVDP
jgi:hypothetical protein